MKNNSQIPRYARISLALALALASLVFQQAGAQVTGSLDTRILHNTSGTANSTVTYLINLSNGWQTGISSVNFLDFTNEAGTNVYSHTVGSSVNYGTVTASLSPGVYKASGKVTTKDNSGNWVSVTIGAFFTVGHKIEWSGSLDMTDGNDQYSFARAFQTSGVTYGYGVSFNRLAANTAGWIEVSAPVTLANGSSVFLLLETPPNPGTFSPADNISYVEFYRQSSVSGIRVKARNASNVYAITTLSGVTAGSRIRFKRTAAGAALLDISNGQTTVYTFAKPLSAQMNVVVLTALLQDQVSYINASFGFPSSALPVSNTFSEAKATGDLSIGFSAVGATGPYHCFASENPVPELKTIYKSLKDSIYEGNIDSTIFFTGPFATMTNTLREYPMGDYYISAFDSRGVKIYSSRYTLQPALTFNERSNVRTAYNEYLSTAPGSYVAPAILMTEAEEGSVTFSTLETSLEHSFGVLPAANSVASGPNTYSSLEYGFCVKNGLLYTVSKGILSSSGVTVPKGLPLEVTKADDKINLVANGTMLASYTITGNFEFKVGARFKEWGIKLQVKPYRLVALPFRVTHTVSSNACTNSGVSVSLSYPAVGTTTFFGQTISAVSVRLYNAAGVQQTSFTNLPPGIYTIQGTISTTSPSATYNVFQYVYAGYATAWESEQNLLTQISQTASLRPHALGNNFVSGSVYGAGVSTGKLAAGAAGWTAFKHKAVSGLFFGTFNKFSLTESPQLGSLNSIVTNMPELLFVPSGGMLVMTYPGYSVPLSYASGVPLVAQRDANNAFTLRQNGSPVGSTVTTYYPGRWKIGVTTKKRNSGFTNIVSNFSCGTPDGQYAQLKYDMDGYYHIMKNGEIKFIFNQEYASSNLTFNIYTSKDKLLRTQTNFPAIATTNGPNYLTIDVKDNRCIGSGFFYLEVINSKKEVMYLRFYNDYSGCQAPADTDLPSN
jgi:hypothetical protein